MTRYLVLATLLAAFVVATSDPATAVGAVGSNSCAGLDACVGVIGSVGDNSCNSDFACFNMGGDVGENSCNAVGACYGAAGDVADNSCNDEAACLAIGGNVSDNSCNGNAACNDVKGNVGEDSCIGDASCNLVRGSVGNKACIGESACEGAGALVLNGSIGDNSCTGRAACDSVGGSVGDNSCVGDSSCNFAAGHIGDNACVGERPCAFATRDVRDCEKNFVPGPFCVWMTLTKSVVGVGDVSGFALTATMSAGPANDFTTGVTQSVAAGEYLLSETGPDGYSTSGWKCATTSFGGTPSAPTPLVGGAITLASGAQVDCAITNTEDPTDSVITITKRWAGRLRPAIKFVVSPETPGCGSSQTVTLAAGETLVPVTATVPNISVGTALPCRYAVTEHSPPTLISIPSVVTNVAPGASVEFTNGSDPIPYTGPFDNPPPEQSSPFGFGLNPVAAAVHGSGASRLAAAEPDRPSELTVPAAFADLARPPLAQTGTATNLLANIALAMIGAGAAMIAFSRVRQLDNSV